MTQRELKELKSRWRWENVKPVFDDAVFALAKKKAGVRSGGASERGWCGEGYISY